MSEINPTKYQGLDIRAQLDKLIEHIRTPLYFNAYAWMISTGLSSALGIGYWILAARMYPTEIVGSNAALISGMIFLAGISQLDFPNVMTRFLPISGNKSYSLVGGAYGISAILSILIGGIVVSNFFPRLKEIFIPNNDPTLLIVFVVSIIVWCVFTIQDSVFSGLRNAVWVPIENVIYAIVKILLLVAFSYVAPNVGIYLSWIIPVAVLIFPMNWIIFARAMPSYVTESTEQAQPETIKVKTIRNYVAGNYVASIFYLSSIRLLPVLITFLSSAENGAYFYGAWTISNAIKLVIINMTQSLTVEGALAQDMVRNIGGKLLKMIGMIIGPLVIGLIIVAPYILQLSGSEYSTFGTPVLRLMLIAVIPSTFNFVYIGIARVENKVKNIVLVQGIITTLILAGCFVFLPLYGITGVGVAILLAESIVAIFILISVYKLPSLISQRLTS